MSFKENNLPEAPEEPGETFGQNDLLNFPGFAKDVKQTEGLLELTLDFGSFDSHILKKHLDGRFHDAYDTRGDPRGLCLIINNKEFVKRANIKLDPRIGTDIDCENLNRLFTRLGYRVRVLQDQTAEQMKSECKRFIFDPEHAMYQSCVLALLSHGIMGKIYGSDSKPVDEKDDILARFNSPMCKLTQKPKLVIVQACRTQLKTMEKQTQYEVTDGATSEAKEYRDLLDRIRKLNYKDSVFIEHSMNPDFADLLIAHSTLPGYVSWRHPGCGTWFVQAIVQIFSANFIDEHVADMLVQVNQLIGDAFGRDERFQMPCPINHLRKKFYFFPNQE